MLFRQQHDWIQGISGTARLVFKQGKKRIRAIFRLQGLERIPVPGKGDSQPTIFSKHNLTTHTVHANYINRIPISESFKEQFDKLKQGINIRQEAM